MVHQRGGGAVAGVSVIRVHLLLCPLVADCIYFSEIPSLSLFLPPPITGWMTWEDGAGINNI